MLYVIVREGVVDLTERGEYDDVLSVAFNCA